MSSENSSLRTEPPGIKKLLAPLRAWAASGRAEADLEAIFGKEVDWRAAYRWIESFRNGDFSDLPPIHVLPARDMPGLWGGYSREHRAIFLSDACPPEFLAEALVEEIGHFLDQEICSGETPGDEGALFAAAVLGLGQAANPPLDFPAAAVQFAGNRIPVEAMSARIVQTSPNQRLNGTTGNDTFVLFNASADIQDWMPSIDWIEASTSISLDDYYGSIENLVLTGSQHLRGTGNASDNSLIGNTGNNFFDGGLGNDTLVGGEGNDTLVSIYGTGYLEGGNGSDIYYIESLDTFLLEEAEGGFDIIYTTNQAITTGSFENIEEVVYIPTPGPPPGDSLSVFLTGTAGNDTLVGASAPDTLLGLGGRDSLVGGAGHDSLDGGSGIDTMVGGAGNDTYLVDNLLDAIVELANEGTDIVLASSNYTLPSGVERLIQSNTLPIGSANISATGNTLSNSLVGNIGNNTLDGREGNDTLFGEGGNDYLIGGAGTDRLDGGSGVNTMDGGAGSDVYIVNDRNDRIINETVGGGTDTVRTRVNFDPLQGTAAFSAFAPDNSPSANKSPSFASLDLQSFRNLENFYILDQASYGVGNAQRNLMAASDGAGALLLGMGGNDSLQGAALGDSLYGDTPHFYAKPDLYAQSPTDTRTQAFLDGVVGTYGADYLDGRAGNDYLDGGSGADTMVGGTGNDTYVQDHVDDRVVATGGGVDELISSVDIHRAPDGVSEIMLVVKNQDRDSTQASITGQEAPASFASFLDASGGNQGTFGYSIGNIDITVSDANRLEVMYSHNEGDTYRSNPTESHLALNVGTARPDPVNPGRLAYEISWSAQPFDDLGVVGYTVRYRRVVAPGVPDIDTDGNPWIWKTYLDGTAQDLRGTQAFPFLVVDNLEAGAYEFDVVSNRLAIPTEQGVTLQGGSGADFISAEKLIYDLPGGLVDDRFTDPRVSNNPLNPLPMGFLFAPEPVDPNVSRQTAFAAYLDGGAGNDLLIAAYTNDGSGREYVFQDILFGGLNTMVGGQGSDTFVVKNGGVQLGDTFDHVIKYGNETPVDFGNGGVGASLNGGQHNLVISNVPFLTLSDTVVSQGKFIDQLGLAATEQFGMGNRLDNYIFEASNSVSSFSTLVGNTGRDSIVGTSKANLLIGGTARLGDDVGMAIRDFAPNPRGEGRTTSDYRDTDPIPVPPNGPGTADPSQFWFVPGYYGGVFDPNRNRDTLVSGGTNTTLDGGAGADSLFGSGPGDDDDQAARRGDLFVVSQGSGGINSQNILAGDAVIGNGGNDTVIFTDSDYLWWSGHQEGSVLQMNGYTIGSDISNLILQAGAPTARNAYGNSRSSGNDHFGWFDELGSNRIVGNEFDNILDGGGVGGQANIGGFDTLTGGGGRDLFIVNGYTNAQNTRWDPVYRSNDGNWNRDASTYTDADYVLITDFTSRDFISLGNNDDFVIGRAPSGAFGENNLRQPDAAPGATEFGVFRRFNNRGNPDLVAHVVTAGGLTLDTANLGAAIDPTGGQNPATAGSQGIFHSINTVRFIQDGNPIPIAGNALFNGDTYGQIQTASRASLTELAGALA